MRPNIISFIFLIGFITTTFSQKDNSNVYDFFGGKSFGNDVVFYRLLFQIKNGKVTGYAFTDEQGTQETKSLINGTFNAKRKTIIFSETKKLLTKSKQPYNNLCYLNGTVSFDLDPKISKIKGTFIEKTLKGDKCNQGEIKIISLDVYDKLKKTFEIEEKLVLVTKKEIGVNKEQKVIVPTFISDEKTTIKDDEEVTIFWNSDKFILDIWDDAKEDDDKITIQFNDKVILKEHILMNKKETLEFDLLEGENKITFTADNTGLIANNTARIDLFDNEIKHQIITKLKLNKSVTVYLIRN